jgi:hypothetical protein
MSSAPIVDRIRIIPRPDDFLDRNVGSSGEVFFNRDSSSLRVYNGRDRSGFELARADLANVDISNLNITNDDIVWIPYETLDDLPSAAENHGMFAHVHSTGKAYYAHAGAWIELANADDIVQGGGGASVDVSATAPAEPSSGNLWLNTTNGKLYIYINDGDSSQWIQPAIQPVVTNYNDLINKPNIPRTLNDLTDVDTVTNPPSTGQVLKWNGTSWTPAADIAEGGAGADADTLDGQDGSYYLNYNNFTNTPTSFTDLTLNGLTTLHQTSEVLNTITGATGVVEHDFSQTAIWYHTSVTNNFTANFTNLPTLNSRVISLALIIVQGSTARLPIAVQVDGAAQTINWQGDEQPTGNANAIDLISFSLIRTGSLWTVLGSLSTYG